jgi:flagellar biogenesis protein FliO
MKRALSLLLLLLGTLLPQLAQAKEIEDVTFGADAADVIVTVLSDQGLNAPSVRTYAGLVRVRFYDADDVAALRFDGDGGAVRVVELGRGSDKSAALNIALGDKTKLALSDVRIERLDTKTVIRIARGLLPAMGKVVARAGKPAEKAAPAQAQPAAQAPPIVVPPPAVVAKPAVTPAESQPAKSEPAKKPLFAAEKKEGKGEGLKLASEKSSTMPMLIALTALLAVAYGALKLFLKKQSVTDAIPAIDVVAQKRLGPRHQLVVVRAFDRDYLLSIQGGQTTVIARSTRKNNLEAAEELLSPVSRRPKAVTNSGIAAARDFEDDEPTFGGELFKQALDQRERAREQTAGFRLEAARAQARAELARRDSSQDEEAASDREANVKEPADDSISESVSGLLRLRRKAGR